MTIGLVAAAVLVARLASAHLQGENVCREADRVKVNVTEQFLQNVTVREYIWCANVPPRCSVYTVKPMVSTRIVEKERLQFSEKCCPGYVNLNDRCVPECVRCSNGTCNNATCICNENCSLRIKQANVQLASENQQRMTDATETTEATTTPTPVQLQNHHRFKKMITEYESHADTNNYRMAYNFFYATGSVSLIMSVAGIVACCRYRCSKMVKRENETGKTVNLVTSKDTCHPQKSSDQVLDLDEKIKFCNCPKKENSGFFYDYPPSTGSYRAASLPEPLTDTETCDLRPRSPSVMMEHTYDEIPTNAHKPNEAVDDNFSVRFNVTKTNVQIHGMPTAKNENQFNYV